MQYRILQFAIVLTAGLAMGSAVSTAEPTDDGSDSETLYIVIDDREFSGRLFARAQTEIGRIFERYSWPTPIKFEKYSFEGPPDSVELVLHLYPFRQGVPGRLNFSGWAVVEYDGGKHDLGYIRVHDDPKVGENGQEIEDRLLAKFGEKLFKKLDELRWESL